MLAVDDQHFSQKKTRRLLIFMRFMQSHAPKSMLATNDV